MADANRNPFKPAPRRPIDPSQFTPFYAYKPSARNAEESVFAEGVSLEKIATAVGTPSYVYSHAAIEGAYATFDRALAALPHKICFSVKVNGNLSVLRILKQLGSGFDIVSGGELDRLRRIGVSGDRIVFSGVGKTREEIRDAFGYFDKGTGAIGVRGILLLNVESEGELEVVLEESSRHVARGGRRPAISIRVNPDVMAGGHPHISTGKHHHKFGIDWQVARRLYLTHKDSPWITWRGISAHIGSQILSTAPYRRAIARIASYVRDLARNGIRLEYVDAGGGPGIRYTSESPFAAADYADVFKDAITPFGATLLIEPGRSIVGSAGVLLTRVIYVKENRGKTFVIVDAAMNDLIRPVLYDAIHPITPVTRAKGQSEGVKRVDVVGPVCESGDFLARDWPLAPVKAGDLLVVWAAGAYAFAQSSNYNARRRPAEVLVEGKRFRIVRKRQSYEDLIRGEI